MNKRNWIRGLLGALFLLCGGTYALENRETGPEIVRGGEAELSSSFFRGEKETAAAPLLPVNLNTADRTELMTLPGIGPAKADRILAFRIEHGPFRDEEELMLVPGIKEKTYEGLRAFITLGEEE